MSIPVYILLPADIEWKDLPGTSAQASRPIRWYLRQSMPQATTQTGLLVDGDGAVLTERLSRVVDQAEQLGGIAIDAGTQEPLAQHLRVEAEPVQ